MSIPDPKLTPGQRAARILGAILLALIAGLMIYACSQADMSDLVGSFRDI